MVKNSNAQKQKKLIPKSPTGFTLIELIVVIAIISLLASVVLSSLGSARQKANDTSKIQAVEQMRSALQLYFIDKGYYPGPDLTAMKTALTGGPRKYIAAINNSIIYFPTTNTNNSVLCGTASCQSYVLGIVLSDSKNQALSTDKNSVINTFFDGSKDNCISGTASVPADKCYDITP